MTMKRALLASPGLDGQPVKGIYFFPGEAAGNLDLYTIHPMLEDDRHWNSDPTTRTRVIDRMASAHINTIVMSYWSNMPQWSPMAIDQTSLSGLLDAVQGRPLVILPAIESGFNPNPDIPQWKFSKDFPSPTPGGPVAPGLTERIGELVALFRGRYDLWARLYDRNGDWRYAVQILHACSDLPGTTDGQFAQAFAEVAAHVRDRCGIPVGFLLDIIGGDHAYVAKPAATGPLLEKQPSVLALCGFASEVFSGKITPGDNNRDNLENLANWKRAAVDDWIVTDLPVILDVTNGMDGRFVWKGHGGGFWGDNMSYTEDRWRNWMSELKGPAIKGITFDTWNGYTEGWVAVPSHEHGETVYTWLAHLLEPDPRQYSHMHYVNKEPTHRVYGAICEKWIQLGADRRFGWPVSDESQSARGRVSYFDDGKSRKAIYWSSATGAHEVHGIIAQTYWEAGGDAGVLGLPISDEEPGPLGGSVSRFEFGQIDWISGEARGRITH